MSIRRVPTTSAIAPTRNAKSGSNALNTPNQLLALLSSESEDGADGESSAATDVDAKVDVEGSLQESAPVEHGDGLPTSSPSRQA